MKRVQKGEYGYLAYKKKIESIKTVIYFAIPLALFFAGLIATGTKKNLLTLVAVLGILPASKNAVLMIMYLKSRGISAAAYETTESALQKAGETVLSNMTVLYEMVFTTQEHTYEVPCMFIYAGSVCGYLPSSGANKKKEGRKDGKKKTEKPDSLHVTLEKHIDQTLKREGISVNVKIFDGEEAFIKRVNELKPLEKAADTPRKAIAKVLKDISL
ncbi:MAG: hypothetical protein K6E75_07955 [Lachnospiraceae bacterium]|nr:hypothetical protein [Lachnospiraceae bacterium]